MMRVYHEPKIIINSVLFTCSHKQKMKKKTKKKTNHKTLLRGNFLKARLKAAGRNTPLRGRWVWWPRRRRHRQRRRWRWCPGGGSDTASACRGQQSCTWRRCLRARRRSQDNQDPVATERFLFSLRKPPPFRPWHPCCPWTAWRPSTCLPPQACA